MKQNVNISCLNKSDGEIRATADLTTTVENVFSLTIMASDGFITSMSPNIAVTIIGIFTILLFFGLHMILFHPYRSFVIIKEESNVFR